MSMVSRESVSLDRIVRGKFLRPIAAVLTYVILPISVLFGLIDWFIGRTFTFWFDLAALVAVSVPVAFLACVLVIIIGNYGIIIKSDGIQVLGYALSRRRFTSRFAPWNEIQQVESWGLYSETIWLGHSNVALIVTAEEAKLILSDPRCPLYGRVPPRIARQIELGV